MSELDLGSGSMRDYLVSRLPICCSSPLVHAAVYHGARQKDLSFPFAAFFRRVYDLLVALESYYMVLLWIHLENRVHQLAQSVACVEVGDGGVG
jgi:hypothetical protein